MQSIELTVDASRQRIIDLTNELERFCAELGDGLVNVFVPHATAGVALMETGSGSDSDLLDALERILPRDDRYRHAHGSAGHGADHLLPALVSPSVTLPVLGGAGRARDLAVGGAGGPERGQPPPARPLQLRARSRRLRPTRRTTPGSARRSQPGWPSLLAALRAIIFCQSGSTTSGASVLCALPDTMSSMRFGGTVMKIPSASAVSSPWW